MATFDPVAAFQRGRRGAQEIQAAGQSIARERAAAPRRNQLADINLQQAQVGAQRGATQFNQQQALQKATILGQSAQALRGLPLEQRDSAFAAISPQLQQFGIDPAQFPPGGFTNQALDQAIAQSRAFVADPAGTAAQFQKGATFQVQTPQGPAIATNVFDPATGGQRLEVTPLGAGVELVSRIGETPTQQQTRQIQTEVQKAAGKAGVKLRTEPAIQSAVTEAVSEVKVAERLAGEQRSNGIALNAYNTAMKGLVDALSGTDTGPFVGLLPALTANQQIAEGAIAAIAPMLKSIFRTAGEGTFTDKDQELLTKMVPTRTDLPAARQSKIQNIDAIIRAKLAQPSAAQQAAPTPAATPATTPAPAPQQAIPAGGQQVGRFIVEPL